MRSPTQVEELQNIACPLISVISPLYHEEALLPYLILNRERGLLAWSDRLVILASYRFEKIFYYPQELTQILG